MVVDYPLGKSWILNANYYSASPLPNEDIRIVDTPFSLTNVKFSKSFEQSELYIQIHQYVDKDNSFGFPTIGYELNF